MESHKSGQPNGSDLYFTKEGELGRALRTRTSHSPDDVLLEEEALIAFPSQVELPLASMLNDFAVEHGKHFVAVNMCETAVYTMLAFLSTTEETRDQILNHFFIELPDERVNVAMKEFLAKLRAELWRLLNTSRFAKDRRLYSTTVDVDALYSAFNAVRLNAFGLNDNRKGLFVKSTLMLHDCDPNVDAIPSGTNMKLVALKAIEVGDMLTMSYLSDKNNLAPSIIRRQHLQMVKQFWCHCTRCYAEDVTRGLLCPHAPCDGFIYPSMQRYTDNILAEWRCHKCNRYFAGADVCGESKHPVLPIIQQEFDALSQVLVARMLHGGQDAPFKSLSEIEVAAAKAKATFGEQHWLFAHCYFKVLYPSSDFLPNLPFLHKALLVIAHWACRVFENDAYRMQDAAGLLLYFFKLAGKLQARLPFDQAKTSSLRQDQIDIVYLLEQLCSLNRGVTQKCTSLFDELSRWLLDRCSCCGRTSMDGVRLQACARCSSVVYCGQRCQKRSWKDRHKRECLTRRDQHAKNTASSI